MKKNRIILIIAIIIFVVALAFFIYSKTLNQSLRDNVLPEEESKTQDILNVVYKDSTIYKEDGTEVKLSEFKDNPVMILFFNEKVDSSIEVLKKVKEMYKKYESKIKFVVINTAQDVNKALKDEYGIEIYYDFYKEAARNFNVTEVPSMIYITDDNEVFNAKSGYTTTDALEANLDIISNNF